MSLEEILRVVDATNRMRINILFDIVNYAIKNNIHFCLPRSKNGRGPGPEGVVYYP